MREILSPSSILPLLAKTITHPAAYFTSCSHGGPVIRFIGAFILEIGRSSADAEVRPNVRLGNMLLFGRSTVELRQTFGVICGFAFAVFCHNLTFGPSLIYTLQMFDTCLGISPFHSPHIVFAPNV